jgi:diadenosine tetraphosphate (Ap4A) HIT family hydrolase
MCEPAADATAHGVRILEGHWSDAYLGRHPMRTGYCYVIFRGRHVCEPTELTPDEAAGFWSEVARVAQAIDITYRPAKVNWLSLGNGVPHLHVHLVPRPFDDPRAGGPLEDGAFDSSAIEPLTDDELERQATTLRSSFA